METKDLYAFGFISLILMTFFIFLDTSFSCLSGLLDNTKTVRVYEVWCIVSGEMYEPFIYLFAALTIIFWVWAVTSWLKEKATSMQKDGYPVSKDGLKYVVLPAKTIDRTISRSSKSKTDIRCLYFNEEQYKEFKKYLKEKYPSSYKKTFPTKKRKS